MPNSVRRQQLRGGESRRIEALRPWGLRGVRKDFDLAAGCDPSYRGVHKVITVVRPLVGEPQRAVGPSGNAIRALDGWAGEARYRACETCVSAVESATPVSSADTVHSGM